MEGIPFCTHNHSGNVSSKQC